MWSWRHRWRFAWVTSPSASRCGPLATISTSRSVSSSRSALIVGYSFGADVAPFLVNRLPEPAKARVRTLTLLGPSATASFEFHVANWFVGSGDARYPVRPEVERSSAPVTCVSGTDETDSICRDIKATHVRMASVGRGHHFSGEYGQLVDLILRQITAASVKDRPAAADAAPVGIPARSVQGESDAGSGERPAPATPPPSSGKTLH